jgi:hypothetical protein
MFALERQLSTPAIAKKKAAGALGNSGWNQNGWHAVLSLGGGCCGLSNDACISMEL